MVRIDDINIEKVISEVRKMFEYYESKGNNNPPFGSLVNAITLSLDRHADFENRDLNRIVNKLTNVLEELEIIETVADNEVGKVVKLKHT